MQQFSHIKGRSWLPVEVSHVLQAASRFNVQDTSTELQHEFCALWNRIVLKAQSDYDRRMAYFTLRPIRNVYYIALHEGTDSYPARFSSHIRTNLMLPPSYPVCNVAGRIHDSASTTFTATALHDGVALAPASLASPDAPSSSVSDPLHVFEGLTDVPPLDNFRPAHQTTIESLRIPATSPDPTTAGAILDIVTSSMTMPRSIPETSRSRSAPPHPSPPAVVALRQKTDLTSSNASNLPSSASSNPVPDNMLSTSPPLSSHSPMTGFDPSSSCPECHCSISVTTAPSASLGPTSALEMGAAAEDDGSHSPKPGLLKEMDGLDSSSANCAIYANAMVTLDIPSQSPSLPSVTDSEVAITGPSLREPNSECTGDHPPNPPHFRYDV